jgi:hypothetical protein
VTTLIASSVVRGSQQGESHGGIYLVDFQRQAVRQVIDWNSADIDWQGRGWDRGSARHRLRRRARVHRGQQRAVRVHTGF